MELYDFEANFYRVIIALWSKVSVIANKKAKENNITAIRETNSRG